MPTVAVDRVRNMGIIAHIDAGKTTTTERFLYYAGKSHRIGEVHEGQAVMDFRPDERERGITISDAATTFYWNGHEINLIDTPGHVDFTAEVERALRVLDGAVVVFDAAEGVEPQSETVWHQADRYRVPRIAFVNKMDRVGADFDAAVESMRERLRATPLPIQLPWGQAESFAGIVDLVQWRLLTFDPASLGREILVHPVPAELEREARRRRELLIERLAELHDPLAERYVEEAPIGAGQIHEALRAVTLGHRGVPVLCGAALRNIGVQPLLDAVCAYLPSPREMPPVSGEDPRTGERVTRRPDPEAPFAALVFKIVATASADLFYLRVYSGRRRAGDRVHNARTGRDERLHRPLRMHADRGEPVETIEAGDIVAVTGLRAVTGDTLCDKDAPVLLEPIRFPDAVVSVAVEPRTVAERERMGEIFARLEREDPTLRVATDPETGQTILSGMGELHLEVTLQRAEREFGLKVRAGQPRVSYRETIGAPASGTAEYRRQIAGEWVAARAQVELEPLADRGARAVAVSALPADALPADLVDSVLETLRSAAEGGGVFGYPMTGVRIVLREASFEPCSQPEAALNAAASLAFREALRGCDALVLEPYGRLEVRVPEEFLGAVVKSLNQRRALVEETRFARGSVVVRGVAPIAEMFGYLTALRSQTQGRGGFSLEPLDYRPLPETLVAQQHVRLLD